MVSVWWLGLLGLAAITAGAGQWLQHRFGAATGELERRSQALGELRPALAQVRNRSVELAEQSRRMRSDLG